jgi:hypothetical protein
LSPRNYDNVLYGYDGYEDDIPALPFGNAPPLVWPDKYSDDGFKEKLRIEIV